MKPLTYIQLIAFHFAVAILIFLYEPFSKLYFLGILVFFGLLVVSKGNKNDEVLYAAAYITGFEVFSRMTDAAFTYEFAKYVVMMFLLLGMFYRGISGRSWPFFLYLLMLVPGILFSAMNLSYGTNVLNAIGFNLSGPVTLGIAALYCYQKPVSGKQLQNLLLTLALPIISMAVYLYLYTPSIRDVLTGTESNFAASGGYGPNQVSTVLGLGAFILFSRLFTIKDRVINLIDLALLGMVLYRAVVTFSRGGVLVAAICAGIFMAYYTYKASPAIKLRLIPRFGVVLAVITVTWFVTSLNTSGLIDKRYANQDALGRADADISSGRINIINEELTAFYEHPFTGLGIGKAKEYRLEKTGRETASHNEMSRLLSEHGIFGLAALGILIFTPLINRITDRSNLLLFPLLAYWFLTINHSSLRIVMPALVYGLALLQIKKNNAEEDTVHRE